MFNSSFIFSVFSLWITECAALPWFFLHLDSGYYDKQTNKKKEQKTDTSAEDYGLMITSRHELISFQSVSKSPKSFMILLEILQSALHLCCWLSLLVTVGPSLSQALSLSSLICLIIRGITELGDCHFQLQCHRCISFPLWALLVWLSTCCRDTWQGGVGLIASFLLFFPRRGVYLAIFTLFIKSPGWDVL